MISFGGLASGLDTNKIIAQLVALERIPLKMLEAKKATVQSKIDLVGTLRGHVVSLKSAAQDLATMGEFMSFSVTPSQEGVAAFSASGTASAGSHTLTVNQTAQADRWAFDAVADPDVDLGTVDGQTVSFDLDGTSYNIAFDVADSSLNEIAAAIASQAGTDVAVSVVNVGTDVSPSYQLVLASKQTGADYRITNIASTVTGLVIDGTPPDAGGNPQSANNVTVGRNAEAVIDGLTIVRSDNDFSDVIQGVSIQVQSSDPTLTIDFTVGPDTEAIKAGLTALVEAYNEVVGFINAQGAYDEDSGPGGALFGDTILKSVRNGIRNALFDVNVQNVIDDTEGYSTLSLLGFGTNNDGTITIDTATLDAKLSANLDAFADLFVDTDGFDNGGALPNTPEYWIDTTADDGLADNLVRAIDRMLNTFEGDNGSTLKGLFDARTEALQDSIEVFDQGIAAREYYLERFEATLVKRFAALEHLMGALNAQGDALAQALLQMSA